MGFRVGVVLRGWTHGAGLRLRHPILPIPPLLRNRQISRAGDAGREGRNPLRPLPPEMTPGRGRRPAGGFRRAWVPQGFRLPSDGCKRGARLRKNGRFRALVHVRRRRLSMAFHVPCLHGKHRCTTAGTPSLHPWPDERGSPFPFHAAEGGFQWFSMSKSLCVPVPPCELCPVCEIRKNMWF